MQKIIMLVFTVSMLLVNQVQANVELQLFSDIDFAYQHIKGENIDEENTNAFSIPTFDFFSSTSFDRWSFLGELLFEFPGSNDIAVDLERGEIGYLVANWLRFRVGRFHSALGYYNDAYHHGSYFEVATGRPILQSFEDEGGLLPVHLIGIHADGRLSLGKSVRLRYDADLANGRGETPDEITNVADHNLAKAANMRLRLESLFLKGLIFGGNFYIDDIPPKMTVMDLREIIVGGHIAYTIFPWHFISEFTWISHTEKDGDGLFVTRAFFAETGYSIGQLTPYMRFEHIDFSTDEDPFFMLGSSGGINSMWSVRSGFKWTANEQIALKIEGQHAQYDLRTGMTSGANQISGVSAQCAVAF